MNKNFEGGVWPTMLTPFKNGEVDYNSLERLIEWYLANNVSGLFAVCQSSEMFFLSLEERVNISKFVVEKAKGRVKVIASGHISESIEDQINELIKISETGIDALIMITNRFAKENESDDIFLANMKKIVDALPKDLPLGLYECPFPYKRLLSDKVIKWCVESKRFYFLKDTCCDIEILKERIAIAKGSNLKIYNANTSTLLDSIELGAEGYSGVMANFHPNLYNLLFSNSNISEINKLELSDELTMMSFIERQLYPVNAKKFLAEKGIIDQIFTKSKNHNDLNKTMEKEIAVVKHITEKLEKKFIMSQNDEKNSF